MKKYNVRINKWDVCIVVPDNVGIEEVKEVLIKTHTEDDFIYNKDGKSPCVLLDYINEKYGWGWEVFSFDIDLNMD